MPGWSAKWKLRALTTKSLACPSEKLQTTTGLGGIRCTEAPWELDRFLGQILSASLAIPAISSVPGETFGCGFRVYYL